MPAARSIISAGGLVVRRGARTWETILVGHGTPTVWRILKGIQEPHETLEETARREILEETGTESRPLELLGQCRWTYQYGGSDWEKTCHFFLMEWLGGDLARHDREFELVEWVLLHGAAELLTYDVEKEIVRKARERLLSREKPAALDADPYRD